MGAGMNAIAALFRAPVVAREPVPSTEARIDRLERRVRYYEELSDEYHYRLVDLEAALERRAVPADAVVA
jgi:hypothetical protein